MLNYLWGGMILIGIAYAIVTGNIQNVTTEAIQSAKDSVTLCITMLGVMSMWTGLMRIAEVSGLIGEMSEAMMPLLTKLFSMPRNSRAYNYIATNMIANMFGLGFAATPAGIKAMEEMQLLNKNKDTATNDMCMFMIINMSSLQIVSMNIIAYRSEYGSINPQAIIGAGLAATVVSTIVGVTFAKICEWVRV